MNILLDAIGRLERECQLHPEDTSSLAGDIKTVCRFARWMDDLRIELLHASYKLESAGFFLEATQPVESRLMLKRAASCKALVESVNEALEKAQ